MQAPHETLPEPLTGLAGLLGLPTFLEARAGLEYLRLLNDPVWSRQKIRTAASRPVLLVPGFMATRASLAPMRQWFQRQGCNAEVASIGLNAGPSAGAAQVVVEDWRIVLAGVKGGKPVPNFISDIVVVKEITILGALGVTSKAYNSAIRLIESGHVPIEKMHTHDFPLEQTEVANRPSVVAQ